MLPRSKSKPKVTKNQISNPMYLGDPLGRSGSFKDTVPAFTFYEGISDSDHSSSSSARPQTPASAASSSSHHNKHEEDPSFLLMDGAHKAPSRRQESTPTKKESGSTPTKKEKGHLKLPSLSSMPWASSPPKTAAKKPAAGETASHSDDEGTPPPLPAKDRGHHKSPSLTSKPKLDRSGSLLKRLHGSGKQDKDSKQSSPEKSSASSSKASSPTKPKPVISNPIPLASRSQLPEQGKVDAFYAKIPEGYDETCAAYLRQKAEKKAQQPHESPTPSTHLELPSKDPAPLTPLTSTSNLTEKGKVNAFYAKIPEGYDETCAAYLRQKAHKKAQQSHESPTPSNNLELPLETMVPLSPASQADSASVYSQYTAKPSLRELGHLGHGDAAFFPPLTPLSPLEEPQEPQTDNGIFFTPDSVGWNFDEGEDDGDGDDDLSDPFDTRPRGRQIDKSILSKKDQRELKPLPPIFSEPGQDGLRQERADLPGYQPSGEDTFKPRHPALPGGEGMDGLNLSPTHGSMVSLSVMLESRCRVQNKL